MHEQKSYCKRRKAGQGLGTRLLHLCITGMKLCKLLFMNGCIPLMGSYLHKLSGVTHWSLKLPQQASGQITEEVGFDSGQSQRKLEASNISRVCKVL